MLYRVGDKVEYKKHDSRSRRRRWVSAEVDDVQNLYGDFIYTIYLTRSGRMKDFVRDDELRFKDYRKYERRLREDEIERCRAEMRQISLRLGQQQRNTAAPMRGRRADTSGRRTFCAARAREPRARSVDGRGYISSITDHNQPRSLSIPPQNYTLPQFLADFAKATLGDIRGDDRVQAVEDNDDNEFYDVDHEEETHQGRDIKIQNADHLGTTGNNKWIKGGANFSNKHIFNNIYDDGKVSREHSDLKTDFVERSPLQNMSDYHGAHMKGMKKINGDLTLNIHLDNAKSF